MGLISICMVLNPIGLESRFFALFSRAIAPGAMVFPTLYSIVRADTFLDAAASGQAAGSTQLAAPPTASYSSGSQSFSIPSGGSTTQVISTTMLFPGGDSTAQSDVTAAMTAAEANGGNGDNAAMLAFSSGVVTRLGTQSNAQGNAYQALNGSILATSHPDLSSDPMFATTKSVYANTAAMSSMLGSCTSSTTSTSTTGSAHITNIQQCDRVIQPTSCDVQRVITGTTQTTSCTPGSYLPNQNPGSLSYPGVNSGQFGNLTGTTNCDPYRVDNLQAFNVAGQNAIYSSVSANFTVDVSTVNTTPVYVGTFSAGGAIWDYGFDNNWDSQVWSSFLGCTGTTCSVTLYFVDQPGFIVGATPPAITWDASGYSYNSGTVSVAFATIPQMTIIYDKPRQETLVTDMVVDTPAGCASDNFCKAAPTSWTSNGSIDDQASSSEYECLDASNSRVFFGLDVTPDTAIGLTPLYPGVPVSPPAPICYHAQARSYSCNFNTGAMTCYTDASGVLQCPVNTGTVPNSCGALQSNPSCSFMSSACTVSDPVSGVCHNYTDSYDCGYNVSTMGTSTSSTTYACSTGTVRCIGTECVNPPTDSANTDFTQVSAALSSAQFAQMDTSCSSIGNCIIFKGSNLDCKKAVGGLQNCCNKPMGVSLVDYMKATYAVWDATKGTQTVAYLQSIGQNVAGELKPLTDGAMTLYSDVSKPLISAYDSIMGESASASTAGSTLAAETLTQPIYQAVGTFLNSISPGMGSSILATDTSGAFTGGLATTGAGAVIGDIMTGYMYIQLALLIIQLAYPCEQSEYELEAKRELKSCHYVGTFCSQKIMILGVQVGCLETKESYCCFSSPLARIIQEQGRPQIGLSWGSAESPNCSGFSVAQMSSLNFSAMDMSEWLAILTISGKIPTDAATATANLTITNMTGAQTPISGTVQPVDTPTVITNTLTNPNAGETTRGTVRSSLGF